MGLIVSAVDVDAATVIVAAAVKIVLWLIGIYYAIKFRRVLFIAAAVAAIGSSVVRAFIDAGSDVPQWLVNGIVFWSTPTVALIVASFISGRYAPIKVGRGWRL